jgi:hypothetical protein
MLITSFILCCVLFLSQILGIGIALVEDDKRNLALCTFSLFVWAFIGTSIGLAIF